MQKLSSTKAFTMISGSPESSRLEGSLPLQRNSDLASQERLYLT
ncbi:hypothetical protein SAMN03159406_02338 [Rhizobium sp. NFR03]|nr:hypothetical protein SAMN03159406_02338 [Rhizobium sp. NFR03]